MRPEDRTAYLTRRIAENGCTHLEEIVRASEDARIWKDRRDEAIWAAREDHSLREIAAAAGLSPQGVSNIIAQWRDA